MTAGRRLVLLVVVMVLAAMTVILDSVLWIVSAVIDGMFQAGIVLAVLFFTKERK